MPYKTFFGGEENSIHEVYKQNTHGTCSNSFRNFFNLRSLSILNEVIQENESSETILIRRYQYWWEYY